MSDYKPKPFTREIAEQMVKEMNQPFDEKRTLCNVLKIAYRCSKEESYNLEAVRALLLEGLWMGKRMHEKLYNEEKNKLKEEYIEQEDEEYDFSIDWSKLDGRNVSQGNWD
jgi:hypothetical protein